MIDALPMDPPPDAAAAPGYLFFFSYARLDRDQYLERFFDDLNDRVRQRGQHPDPSFRDLRAIKPGDKWPAHLMVALQSSATLLCLYSPWYFKREFCGKEFRVFVDRQVAARAGRGTAGPTERIIPVLWLPERDLIRLGLPPKVVANIAYTITAHVDRYRAEGLSGIMRRSGRRGAYMDILDELADKILVSSDPPLPPLAGVLTLDEVRNAFEALPDDVGGGPNVLRVVYVAGSDEALDAARPFAGDWQGSLRTLVGELALQLRMRAVPQRVDPDAAGAADELAGAVRAAAARAEVVVVVDAAGTPAAHALLQQTAQAPDPRGGVLLLAAAPLDVPDAPDAARVVAGPSVGTVAAFRERFAAVVAEMQRRTVATGDVRRRVDAEGPERRPIVAGPRESDRP